MNGRKLCFVEVGLSSEQTCFVGISGNKKVTRYAVIGTDFWSEHNVTQRYLRVLKKNNVEVVSGDIYSFRWPENLPLVAFLAMENVLNDPAYERGKNIDGYLEFLKSCMTPGGLVLIGESFIQSRWNDENNFPYIKMIERTNSDFRVLSDGVASSIPWNQNTDREKIALNAIGEIANVDEPLRQQLERKGQDFSTLWLLLVRR